MNWVVFWLVMVSAPCPSSDKMKDEYGRQFYAAIPAIACHDNVFQSRSFSKQADAEKFMEIGKQECPFQCSKWEIKEVK
jgi:hypothetical protein